MVTTRTGLSAGQQYPGSINYWQLPTSGSISLYQSIPTTSSTNVVLLFITCRYTSSDGSTAVSATTYDPVLGTVGMNLGASINYTTNGTVYNKAALFYYCSNNLKLGSSTTASASYTTSGEGYAYATGLGISLATNNPKPSSWVFTQQKNSGNVTASGVGTYTCSYTATGNGWPGWSVTSPTSQIYSGVTYLGGSSISSADSLCEVTGSNISLSLSGSTEYGTVALSIPPALSSAFFAMF